MNGHDEYDFRIIYCSRFRPPNDLEFLYKLGSLQGKSFGDSDVSDMMILTLKDVDGRIDFSML